MAATSEKAYFQTLLPDSGITDDGRLERAISTSCWVDNLIDNKKQARVSFHPLQSTVTFDAENVTPDESVVFVKSRPAGATTSAGADDDGGSFLESPEYLNRSNVGTLAVTSLRAASEIMNSIASTSLLQYTMYSSRNLVPLFLSTSNHKEFGKKTVKPSMMKRCFSREHTVESLMEELHMRKINAAKAFAHAVREKSIVNMALAAWSAGNAANLQHLVRFSKMKYGPQRMYKTAGMFRAAAGSSKTSITSTEYLQEISKRHKGTLNFDSAPSIFNGALARVFAEFKEAAGGDERNPLFSTVRQNRRRGEHSVGGMLAPRKEFSVADYMVAEKDKESVEQVLTKISSDFEILRGGQKRKADTEVSDLEDTLAQSISDSAIDVSRVTTSADLGINGDWEWSMHITQLFAQAFLEAMSSLLSCSFGVKDPFSDQGLRAIENVLRKRVNDRNIDMSPSVLADEYLLFAGNFQIPFHVSDPRDVVEGRQVCPNTPVLTIVTRYATEKGTVTDIELRDRLLVKDQLLDEAIAATNSTPPADRNTPTDIGAAKRPMLGGCLPVIRGAVPQDADDIANSLANDWYISTGVYYSIGKTSAAICAGYQKALGASCSLSNNQEKAKKSMRRNADRCARLSALLGQTVSAWGHQEHNSSLDSFWSSSAAVRSKTVQDALSRSEILGARKQLDATASAGADELTAAEQRIRDTFYSSISHGASHDIDAIVNFSDEYSKYSDWFQNDDASGIARKSWDQYVASVASLSEFERRAFNVRGLFSAIDKFKFPLVPTATRRHLTPNHRLTNLKAANRIINGLTEMVIQSAFDCAPTAEIMGSAADGWGPPHQLEPSRIKALKLLARFGRRRTQQRPDVISIPVSRTRASSGIASVDIPAVIMSHLISDKKILDTLCGEGMDLGKEITQFLDALSGKTTKFSSILRSGKHSIMLFRYIWMNTAVVSLTDTNIRMAVNVAQRGLGDALYSDYLSIRSLVSSHNRALHNFSAGAIAKRYLSDSGRDKSHHHHVTIKSDADLARVLQQTTDVLSAFTDKKDGISADSANMTTAIKRVDDLQRIKNTTVVIPKLSNIISVENLVHLFNLLRDIGKLNANVEEPLRRLALGKGLTKTELDNYVHPDMTKLFQRELQDAAQDSPLETPREITIDLNIEVPAIVKTNAEHVRERIAALNAIPADSRDPAVTAELDALSVELAQTRLAALKNTVTVPGFLTPAAAIAIVEAFTRDGRQSNKSTHMGIMVGAINEIEKMLDVKDDTLSITVDKAGRLVQKLLLLCFICAHSSAGPVLITHGVKDLSRLLTQLVAETSLSVSRLQSSFYPLPPSALSLSGMLKFDKNVFDEMTKDYVAEIVNSLSTATTTNNNDLKLFKAGENFNKDDTPVVGLEEQQQQQQETAISSSLKNPASVWSCSALPHFDVAVVPKFHSGLGSDQLFRLSAYYQGMHKMSSSSSSDQCKPQVWDTTLAGNKAETFFNLDQISDTNRSFNSALDTLIASPVEICDLVSRETVRSSNDVVHNIGSRAEKIQNMLEAGASVVKPLSTNSSPFETSIKETICALSKSHVAGSADAAKEIIKTWNTLSVANCKTSNGETRDVVRAPLTAVCAFRQNVVEATKAVYELAAVCGVMSKDESVRAASRKIMATVEDTSPVIQDIGIERVVGLVSTVASPKQYKKFLRIVSDYRNSLVRLVNPPTAPFSTSGDNGGGGPKAVYDGMLYAASSSSVFPSSSSLSDQFWMGVFNECLETSSASGAAPKIYGSRVNTYAAISSGSTSSAAAVDKEKVQKSLSEIEKYISELTSSDALTKLIDAQHMYAKLSDITAASSVYRNSGGNARQQSDAILSAMLHELAPLVHAEKPELASQLALAGHIIVAKGVNPDMSNRQVVEMYNNLLSVAGVTDYAHLSANALCHRLKSEDIKMFLCGTMLQQGMFVTFLLNNIVFAQMSESLKMDQLSTATKSALVKLVAFCETLSDALSSRHARRSTRRGDVFPSEEAKVDASFVTALYAAYSDLHKKSESATLPAQQRRRNAAPPRPKRNSTLADVLEAPSVIHKSFVTSFCEKSAASRQVKNRHSAVISLYKGKDKDDDDTDLFAFSDDDDDEKMSVSSSSSSSSSSSESEDDEDGGYSYDALDRLNALAAPLKSIYGGGGDFDDDDDNEKSNNPLSSILEESDEDYDDDDEDHDMPRMEDENTARRRSERVQYGPGFLSHSFLLNHPTKTRAFLTRGKKFKTSSESVAADEDTIFSDQYSSSDDDDDEQERRRGGFTRRSAQDQCAFMRRVMRAFAPTRISLINGRVSLVAPVGTDTASGFFQTYQKANKKQREDLRRKYNIVAEERPSSCSPRELRRSLVKATAYVARTQRENADKFYTAIVGEAHPDDDDDDPSVVLGDTVLFSKDLRGIVEKRDRMLQDLTDVSSALFTSSVGQGPGGSSNAMARARQLSNRRVQGYLGVPLRNLAGCLGKSSVNSMLSVTDRSHLDWLTAAGLAFARSFNVTTFHALDSTLKTAGALADMYNAFAKLVTSQDREKIRVKSTLLDSIFNTRMSHVESVLGLVCPTAFINHEMPSDPNKRKEVESSALCVLRGVNSGQMSSIDIGDTSGLLSFLTRPTFAGRGGERGGLSLYRMSITDALLPGAAAAGRRLKGAVSLEVGRWKMCDNAIFSRRSKELVDYCSRNSLTLESAVGPVARFIPDGSDPKAVGLSKLPPLNVADDPAALRLESAEHGCGAPGRFITASAVGNLYGRIDDILNLAKKFVVRIDMFDSAVDESAKSIQDVAKNIISRMKARRSKSLKTPFGETIISQATNYPATSNAIVLRAREMRHSIATIVSDISKKHGISLLTDDTKVSVRTFERILETSAVLANTKMTLRGIENRLAAAYTRLKQFKRIANDGMSESRAVICAVAEAMTTLVDDSKKGFTVADFMNQDNLFEFIVNSELKNIEDAKRQITCAVEGACQLHAKMLGMLASAADINSERRHLKKTTLGDASATGRFIKHPDTGMWLKTDEDCNTPQKGDIDDHRRVAHSIMTILENNRNKALRSKLHTMSLGKYSVSDIFVVDESDARNVDKLVEKLSAALDARAQPPPAAAAAAAVTDTTASSSSIPLGNKIPYIPIIFENRHDEEKKKPSDNQKQDEARVAQRHLQTQEANDLSNILSIATKHKFVTHNQAATVAIFNGSQKAESIVPGGSAASIIVQSLMSRLPPVSPSAAARVVTGTSMQLPPSALPSSSSSIPVALKLEEYALKVASNLNGAQEYKDVAEADRKINAAVQHLNAVENNNFFTAGGRPEIEQSTMSTLSQSQSAKEGAFELFEKVLKQLENYTPDPSLSTLSLPINASSLLDNSKTTQDCFKYAYERLHAPHDGDHSEAVLKNTVEQEAAVRIPLLLTYPQFASTLKDVVSNLGTYYQRVERIKQKITEDAKHAISSAFKETVKEITADRNALFPIIDELSEIYSNEADAIKTAIKVLENKKSELEFQNSHTSSIVETITARIEAGENNVVDVNDMLSYGNKADNDQQFLQNLRKFAKDNCGAVFSPSPSKRSTNEDDARQTKIKDSYRNLLNDAVATIKAGQEGVATDYEPALGKFPAPFTSYGNLTMQVAEKQQRERLASVEMFIGVLADRISRLRTRLQNSTQEATEIDNKKIEIENMFRRQMEDRHDDAKKNAGIAEAAAQSALVKDLSQSPLLMALSGKVDRLLQRVEKIHHHHREEKENTTKAKPANAAASAKIIEDSAYACYMAPFHEAIKRIAAMYDRDRKGPLNNSRGLPTSEADLQLMSIVDLSRSVINSTGGGRSPDTVPSSVIPGLCQLCAMAVTNLHEAVHESSHSFNFEGKRSRQRLAQMLQAATSGSRHDVLAMLEANNGYVKEFAFTHRQKVACVTPVNTLLAGGGDVIAPNTVLVPTSELINCPGIDNDKFRSAVHRSVDRIVADAPKSSASIVETLARAPTNAEKLFFPFKDQRRHFNSITDAIITNMNSQASCQLNTTCDQNLVRVDVGTGLPVFVGRRAGKSRLMETTHRQEACCCSSHQFVDMETKYMVAPGSLLNANKEETLRLNRLSDINNVRHYGTDVHVAGANSAWRIGEAVKAACSESDETTARKLLLLGSVSAVSAQKSAQHNNDPTAMLNSTWAVQNLINEAFPSPTAMAAHAGAAEAAFANQLAYRHRLFPSSRPVDILGMIRRYSDAYAKVCPPSSKNNNVADFLKQNISNVPLLTTSIGAFEEVNSAVKNTTASSSAVNKLAIQAMTDTVVDTLSAVSRVRVPPPPLATTSGKQPPTVDSIARVSRDAFLVSQINEGATTTSFSSFLKAASSTADAKNTAAAEHVIGAILDGAKEANSRLDRLGVGKDGAGRPEVGALYRGVMSSVLRLNEDEITRDLNDTEMRLEKRQLKEAFNELKKSMLVSNRSCLSAPLSVLLSRNDAASGRLTTTTNNNMVMNAVDEFNTTPLLVRHLMLDPHKSPVPLAKEVRDILTQPKAVTARALLSESSPLLAELCLFNTRDTQPERAVDRLVSSAYLVKQAKRFDGVDPLFPAALTGACHLMLSSMDGSSSSSSSFLNNIKLHMNDTTCFLKNIERYERFLGKYGDAYAMSHRQNCNCPFALHHDFRPSADEALVSSFAFARPEVSVQEIRDTPYQTNKLLNDKHYVMALSKIDTRVTGSALLKKVSEWTDMRMNVSFNGAFEPSRLALSNSGMTTAGVNLDVIVRPNNAKNIMGILECHRNHVCSVDAKSTIAAAMPAVFQSTSTDDPGNVSELVQNALPHNRYIQKSTMSAPTVIFANVLEQLIRDLGNVIVNELAGVLASSVSESVFADTKSMMDSLGSTILFDDYNNKMEQEENYCDAAAAPTKLVSESMKNAIFQTLMSGKAVDPENVPFASSANGALAYDFLLSKDKSFAEKNAESGAAASVANMPAAPTKLRNHLARVFEAISKQVSDAEFGNILDDIEAKIVVDDSSSSQFSNIIRREFNKILSFLKILRQNITPALLDPNGKLAEKVAVYLSLLSTKSRLENLLQYGLSNSSSCDLSHLKSSYGNGTKNIEDMFLYRNVHPVLVMALPENFTALLQQEQCDADLAIDNRRALTTFLNHPNTASMATGARASLGAGGGNPLGLCLSSHVLHESTVTTCDPVVDADSNLSFHSPVTQDPTMVVNPFKESAKLKITDAAAVLNDNRCSYLQVSMPTESSGLVTNTGVKPVPDLGDTFKFTRRDGSPVHLPKITPSVLCSDASSNLLDSFSRADVILNDVSVRFAFVPELISAIANIKGVSTSDVVKEMAARASSASAHKNASVDPKTGDVVVKNGTFPDVKSLLEAAPSNVNWGEEDKQKLHARVLPAFIASNPLASASVNGVPITREGFLLTEQKRRKAAGISTNSQTFGAGSIGTGALRAAAASRLTSDLEPLRKGWENTVKLQAVFSKAAAKLKTAVEKNRNKAETAQVVQKLYENFTTLNRCKEILQSQTAMLVATSDLVTGGYAGDPAAALVAPVRVETTGIVGAISAPVRGLGHLLKRDGMAAVNSAIAEKLSLSSSGGRVIPEHGVVHKSSTELLSDADSIHRLLLLGEKNNDGKLAEIVAAIGGNRAKHEAIVHLLASNPGLLENVYSLFVGGK